MPGLGIVQYNKTGCSNCNDHTHIHPVTIGPDTGVIEGKNSFTLSSCNHEMLLNHEWLCINLIMSDKVKQTFSSCSECLISYVKCILVIILFIYCRTLTCHGIFLCVIFCKVSSLSPCPSSAGITLMLNIALCRINSFLQWKSGTWTMERGS